MAEIVNLRRARKQKARIGKEDQANQNRTKFGENKSARKQREARLALEERKLDGAKQTD